MQVPLLSTGEYTQAGLLHKVRTCADMREINYKTPQDRIQVPKIKEILQNLIGSVFITKLDLKQLCLQFKYTQIVSFYSHFSGKAHSIHLKLHLMDTIV